jgi:MauM/NapG family ferredoxin protein
MDATESTWFHPSFILLLLVVAASVWVWRRFSLRRGLQVLSLGLFTALFWLAAFGGRPLWPVDFFLFSDPLLALVHTVAGRVLVPLLLCSLGFLVLAAVLGRVFCSHVCPLGTTLDLSDRLLGRRQTHKGNREEYRRARKAKFFVLLAILAGAVVGFNLLGFADPLVLFTRFSAILLYPFNLLMQDVGLEVLRPVGAAAGWVEMAYLELILPAFEGAVIMAGLLLVVLLLSRLQPRFWCRSLCPLGALLGWTGRWAPYRRRVGEACTACNRCVRECPTGAIHEGGKATDRGECIVCLNCVRTCPEKVVRFGFGKKEAAVDLPGPALGRRGFLGGMASGLAAGLSMRTDVLHPSKSFLPLPLRDDRLIRPPGALPEPEFLSRCVRCGECLRACLTNTLQPDWYRAGLEGWCAPHLNLRHAACEQGCAVCGQVCPTEAIRPLPLAEKLYAKIGTAVVLRDKCIAWAQDRRCLICDEQCPYNAISFWHDEKHKVGLPVVDANKCNGCGQCEDKCPIIGESAIVVTPQGELRLGEGSYREEAKALGLVFEAKGKSKDALTGSELSGDSEPEPKPGGEPAPDGRTLPDGQKPLPPGIIPEEKKPLPPGIIPED